MSRRGKRGRLRLALGGVAVGLVVLFLPAEASAPCGPAYAESLGHPAVHPGLNRSCASNLPSIDFVASADGAPTAGLDCQGDGKCPFRAK